MGPFHSIKDSDCSRQRRSDIGSGESRVVHCLYSYQNWGIGQLFLNQQLARPTMDDNGATRNERQQADGESKKKLYQKPAFRYERVFETRALSCGKVDIHTPACNFTRKVS
jgi:hypothetical protein